MSKMNKLETIKELFELFIGRRKFYLLPIIFVLLALIGVTALAQSGIVTLIYPI